MPKRMSVPLDKDLVVRAALELLDDGGLDAFNMRALAQRLGTFPATVYWHVGHRNEVLSAVFEVVLDEVELPDSAVVVWDEWLSQFAHEYRRVMHRHPTLGAWVASHLYSRVTAPTVTECILAVLHRGGFRDQQLASAFNAYVGSLVGWVATELISTERDVAANWAQEYEDQVRSLRAEAFPTIVANVGVLADEVFSLRWHGGSDKPLDASFEFAVKVWLRGLQQLLPPTSS
ncbi:MAG: TetR/AcrR family transcriptional regulator C-terminal domain-containing protein [Acidimicrobiales bacterium]